MQIDLSISLTSGSGGGSSASYTVNWAGLVEGAAQPGDHASIGFTTTPAGGVITQKWGSTFGGSEYGTAANPTDYSANDGGLLYLEVTRDAEVVSRSVAIRYAAGSAAVIADGQSWTVDDTAVSIDGSASGTGLTFTYVLTSVANGVTQHPTIGLITGTPDTVQSGTATTTATDQYGRQYQDTFTWASALRAQATAAQGLGPYSFPEDSAIAAQNLAADFTLGGNTLTYAITGTALPASLVVSSAGSMTGTPNDETADATYTVRGTDEYGRTTDSPFNLEVTQVVAPAVLSNLSIDAQNAAGDVGLNYTIDRDSDVTGVWTSSNTKPTAAEINAGTATDQVGSNWTLAFTTSGSPVNTPLPADQDATLYLWLTTAGSTVTYPVSGNINTNVDTTAPNASLPLASATGGSSADWSCTSDEASGTIFAAIRLASTGVLTKTLIENGGAGVVDRSTDTTPTVDANNGGNFTGLTSETSYAVDMFQRDAVSNEQAAPVSSANFLTDDVASPALTNPVDATDGSTASTGSVDTDEGNGTLYYVVTTSATPPNAAQIKDGNDNSDNPAAFSGNQAVSGTGTQTITPAPSGLTAATAYTTHFVHTDASSNDSNVATASGFTTDAGASGPTLFTSYEIDTSARRDENPLIVDNSLTLPTGTYLVYIQSGTNDWMLNNPLNWDGNTVNQYLFAGNHPSCAVIASELVVGSETTAVMSIDRPSGSSSWRGVTVSIFDLNGYTRDTAANEPGFTESGAQTVATTIDAAANSVILTGVARLSVNLDSTLAISNTNLQYETGLLDEHEGAAGITDAQPGGNVTNTATSTDTTARRTVILSTEVLAP